MAARVTLGASRHEVSTPEPPDAWVAFFLHQEEGGSDNCREQAISLIEGF
jgi:hypothetical protein